MLVFERALREKRPCAGGPHAWGAYVYSDPQASSAEENNQHSERPFQSSSTMPPVRRLRTDSGGPSSLRGEAELRRERRPKANNLALTDSAVVMRLTLEGSPLQQTSPTRIPPAHTANTRCSRKAYCWLVPPKSAYIPLGAVPLQRRDCRTTPGALWLELRRDARNNANEMM